MKKVIIIAALCALAYSSFAQDLYMTRNGKVSFFSKTPMENIEAVNNEVTSILNLQTGELVFAILIKSFHFERALMEEHFNENYLESTKMPKSTFQGKITNLPSIDFKTSGTYPVMVEGDLTIHGVKKHITSSGTITVGSETVSVTSALNLKPGDYNIAIPSLVADKIAETIDVKIACQYAPKK